MKLNRFINTAFLAGLLLLSVVGVIIYISFDSFVKKADWVLHTQEVSYASEKLISAIKDAETGQRGYFITGDSTYLTPYVSGVDAMGHYLKELRRLTNDNQSQHVRVDSLQKKISAKAAILKYTISLKNSSNTVQQITLMFPKAGKELMDEIRAITLAIQQEENRLMTERVKSYDTNLVVLLWLIGLTIAGAFFVAVFSFIYIKKQVAKNEAYEKELYRLNQEITMSNEEMNAYNEELTAANEELSTNNEELQITTDQLNISNEMLERYAEEIKELYNNAPCGYHSTDEDAVILNINDTELKWLGYSREEVIGKMKLHELISPKGGININDTYQEFIEKGYLNNLESEMIRKDGSVFPILANVTYVKDENGNFLKTHATIFDITEQRKMQQKLVESEQNYRVMAENITDMLSRHDVQGRYFYVSPSCERLLGYSPEEMKGKSIYDLFHPDDVESIRLYYMTLLEMPDISSVEHRFRKKDGGYIWFETVSKAFKDPRTGKITEVLSVSRDISLRKEYEDKLKLAYNELEQIKTDLEFRVRERTEKLDQALKELQTRNHELDNYVYKVSHDLRAPLASILGLVNLTKLDNDISAIKHYLSLIENRVNKSDEFIKSVLNHSRILNSEINPVAIDFRKIIDTCIEELRYLPNLEKMDFIFHITTEGDFYSDELRVNILFKNLISNAVKYRNPSVDKSYMKFDIASSEQSAFITVEDNGQGIEELYMHKIFDMFFRGTQQSDGSGLGLYIVKQTLERIAGTISVESKVNKGTIFRITLSNLKTGTVDFNAPAVTLNQLH
ncbi:PAS domain S-box protein [Rhodocytophaga rosea]|uniref:histidine kinase n=1 Tax=Rhodocytophaga rosea TaxID=2704465 RepID=A0A6C0GGB9_9BACT|nr:PAS domain S-box protein [Rhodocytophaga rosea]QHT66874.1 PAS domain S-box protein [Rhodocytophaga rosea]